MDTYCTNQFTVDSVRKTLSAEISDLTPGGYIPQCIQIKSHRTGKVYPFSTDANNELRDGSVDNELLGWKYQSSWLPGWEVVIYND
jgi:hypothetical protein